MRWQDDSINGLLRRLKHWFVLLRFREDLKRLPTGKEPSWPHPQRHR